MEMQRNYLKERRVTVCFSILMLVVYLITLLLAGSFQSNAAYAYISNLGNSLDGLIALITPILHSSHNHIAQNLVLFFIFGSMVERRDTTVTYIGFIFITGILSNSIVAPLVEGAAIGVSSVNYGLKSREIIYRGFEIAKSDSLITKDGLVVVIISILIIIGFLYPVSGASIPAHATGLIVGLIWETAIMAQSTDKRIPKLRQSTR